MTRMRESGIHPSRGLLPPPLLMAMLHSARRRLERKALSRKKTKKGIVLKAKKDKVRFHSYTSSVRIPPASLELDSTASSLFLRRQRPPQPFRKTLDLPPRLSIAALSCTHLQPKSDEDEDDEVDP